MQAKIASMAALSYGVDGLGCCLCDEVSLQENKKQIRFYVIRRTSLPLKVIYPLILSQQNINAQVFPKFARINLRKKVKLCIIDIIYAYAGKVLQIAKKGEFRDERKIPKIGDKFRTSASQYG